MQNIDNNQPVRISLATCTGFQRLCPLIASTFEPLVGSFNFERFANVLRVQAVQLAQNLDNLNAGTLNGLVSERLHYVTAAVDLYYYLTPQVLLLSSALAPAREFDDAKPGNSPVLDQLFEDIGETVPMILTDGGTRDVSLWPDYLQDGWQKLRTLRRTPEYLRASSELRDLSIKLAAQLPPMKESPKANGKYSKEVDALRKLNQKLPSMLLNIALFQLDWHARETRSN